MKAVCVGINSFKHFPDSTLYGCVNDARDMAAFFETRGVTDIALLTDRLATYDNITKAISRAVTSGEGLLLSISSHGTQVPDQSGDEPDRYDEAFLCHDTGRKFDKLLTDDELFTMLSATDARVEVWLDCCHSGTGTRLLQTAGNCYAAGTRIIPAGTERRARFVRNPATARLFPKAEPMRQTAAREMRNMVLWSGCRADQVSYDAYIAGRSNGAFTRAWLTAWQARKCSDRASIKRKMVGLLNDWEYDQDPQLECGFFRKYSGLKFTG